MATTIQYSFYQVANSNPIDSGYTTGAIVFNKTRKELTVFGPNNVATVYAGGLANASFKNQKLTLTDFNGASVEVDLSIYATSEAVGTLIGNYYTKQQVDNALTTKVDKDDVYTKEEVNNLISEGVGEVVVPEYTIAKLDTATEGASATYQLTKDGTGVGVKIDIPKDMVVSSGQIVTNPTGQTAGTYIELTLANATNEKIYINVANLVDAYSGSTYITVNDYTISVNETELDKRYVKLEGGTMTGALKLSSLQVSSTTASIGTSTQKFAHAYIAKVHGDLDGTASKATSDGNNNVIVETYATKSELASAGYWKQLD